MKADYEDIRSRIAEPPKWFDEYGVPRYCEFHPKNLANIYAREAVLVHIECQNCGHGFDVAMSRDRMADVRGREDTLAVRIRMKSISYRDPPNIGCCASGPTMTSVERTVLQYWHRVVYEWARDPSYEVDVYDND